MSRQAHHRLAGSYIEVCSDRPLPELLDLCKKIAEEVEPTGLYKHWKVRIKFTGSKGNSLRFAVPGLKGMCLTFQVIGHEEDDQTIVRSQITGFRTKQMMFLGLIPSGPKKLEGYNWYENFMLDLEDAVKDLDPEARVVIEEEPG